MIWERIPKENSTKPRIGKTYRDWKEIIAQEGNHQCVYCAIHEANFGGIRNYHVEHYKPKSRDEFKVLINEITNLYYACSICNCFKGNDWPEEPLDDLSNCSYPNPSVVDYKNIFKIDQITGCIEGLNTASKYILNKLNLNRPQLLLERRTFFLREKLNSLLISISLKKSDLFNLVYEGNSEALKLLKRTDTTNNEIIHLLNNNDKIRPYNTKEVKREKEYYEQ